MQMNNVLIFGDSITYGVYDEEKGGWANQLRFHLEQNNPNEERVYNLGIPGEISEETLKRFDIECKTRYLENENNVIIFAIGINDTQHIHNQNRVGVESYVENIQMLYTQAKKYTEKIVFVGLSNVDETKVCPLPHNADKCFYNEKIECFDSALQSFCKANEIIYIPIYGILKMDELSDGLHPNAVGHQKMFEEIKRIDYLFK